MYTIENDQLRVMIREKGAELSSLFSRIHGLDYLWDADPAYWAKSSPILFPIVGTLKKNTYQYEGKNYELGRHGFARDLEFEAEHLSQDAVRFVLESNEATLVRYPFFFRLEVSYTLEHDTLKVEYRVVNTGQGNMYFSIGAHPAFRLPLEAGLDYQDYHFAFNHVENALRWLISSEGLIEPAAVPFIENTNRLDITRELFSRDALVFKHLNADRVTLRADRGSRGLELAFPGFPYLGLWAASGADFVCIEPWCGIADSTLSNQQLITKEGINLLTPGQDFHRHWTVRVF